MADLKDYSWIGAIPSSLNVHDDLIHASKDIDNSRNYMKYGNETIFYREKRIHGKRYLVYFSPRLRSRRIESFFAQLAEKETGLKELGKTGFKTQQDLIGSVESALKGFRRLIDVQYDMEKLSFAYSLKHKAIQRRNNRLGFTVPTMNTLFPATAILQIYRQKDVVEKAFSHVKPSPRAILRAYRGGNTRAIVPHNPWIYFRSNNSRKMWHHIGERDENNCRNQGSGVFQRITFACGIHEGAEGIA